MKLLIYLAIGLVLGYFLIPQSWRRVTGAVQSVVMVATLFFMGVSLGSQENLLESLREAGISAFLIALVTAGGSVLAVWLIERRFFRAKETKEERQ